MPDIIRHYQYVKDKKNYDSTAVKILTTYFTVKNKFISENNLTEHVISNQWPDISDLEMQALLKGFITIDNIFTQEEQNKVSRRGHKFNSEA